MKEWCESKRVVLRKSKQTGHYSVWDFLFDLLDWVPGLFVLLARMILWMLQGFVRFVYMMISH